MKEREINAGYEIIERFPVGEQGFALGHSETAPAPYVTWQYRTADPMHFFWGHYEASKDAAYEDYAKRIEDEVQSVSERTHKPPLLPAFCYTLIPSSGDLIKVLRGQKGYQSTNFNIPGDMQNNRRNADSLNEGMGVTKSQEAAMLAGSMFGWHTKAADPRSYDENGQPKRTKKHDEPER